MKAWILEVWKTDTKGHPQNICPQVGMIHEGNKRSVKMVARMLEESNAYRVSDIREATEKECLDIAKSQTPAV